MNEDPDLYCRLFASLLCIISHCYEVSCECEEIWKPSYSFFELLNELLHGNFVGQLLTTAENDILFQLQDNATNVHGMRIVR